MKSYEALKIYLLYIYLPTLTWSFDKNDVMTLIPTSDKYGNEC